MKKVIFKIILKIILMTLVVITLYNSQCFALGDVANDATWQGWSPTLEDDSKIIDKTGVILGTIRVIGIIVSVATLSVIGIKVMLGSVEEKANYKQTLIPWVIGAAMVFAITTIPTTIYDITKSTVRVAGSTEESILSIEQNIAGFKESCINVRNKWSQFLKENRPVKNKLLSLKQYITSQIISTAELTPYGKTYTSHLKYINEIILKLDIETEEKYINGIVDNLNNHLERFLTVDQDIKEGYITKENIEEKMRDYENVDPIYDRLKLQKELWKLDSKK